MDPTRLFSTFPVLGNVAKVKWPNGTGAYIGPGHVFTYIPSGRGVFRLANRSYSVEAGDALLMYPHLLHVITSESTAPLEQLVLSGNLAAPYSGDWPLPLVVRIAEADRERVASLFAEIQRAWLRARTGDAKPQDTVLAAGSTLQLLALYLANCSAAVPVRNEETHGWPQVEQALQFIHDEYQQDLTVEDMAAAAQLSASSLTRFFKRYTGLTPYQYLSRLRVGQARLLLWRGQLSCSEIARRTGFGSVYVFSRAFRRYQGCSPSQWRGR